MFLVTPDPLFTLTVENTLKAIKLTLPLLLVVSFMLTSCGYRNPYVYSGPDKNIYITNWKNRTNLLRLNSDITQSLNRWYQKSGSIRIVKSKENADLILGGEILSIDLPSLSYGANSRTKEVKVKLTVRYILMDLKSGKVLFEIPKELRTEEYTVTSDVSTTSDNENEAIETIIDEMSQKIYLRTITELPKL